MVSGVVAAGAGVIGVPTDGGARRGLCVMMDKVVRVGVDGKLFRLCLDAIGAFIVYAALIDTGRGGTGGLLPVMRDSGKGRLDRLVGGDVGVAGPAVKNIVIRIVRGSGGIGGRGGVAAVVDGLGLQHRAVPVLEDDGVRFNLPHGVEHGVGVRGIGRALRVFGRGRGRIGRPAKEGVMLARRFGGGEGQILVKELILRVRRAGAALGVVRDVVDLFKTEGQRACAGRPILHTVKIGLIGFKRSEHKELRSADAEIIARLVAVGRIAGIVLHVDVLAVIEPVCRIVAKDVAVGGAGAVDQIFSVLRGSELIVFDLTCRVDGRCVVVVRDKRRGVIWAPERVIGFVARRNGDRF